jgi:hypothetical protein
MKGLAILQLPTQQKVVFFYHSSVNCVTYISSFLSVRVYITYQKRLVLFTHNLRKFV